MNREGRERKREQILDAAVVEIARSGYFRTTVSDIARRAGVADGTIYLYFSNKEAILIGIFERAMDRFVGEGKSELSEQGGAADKLGHIVRQHLSVVGRDRDLAVIFQVELRHSLHFMNILSRSRMREYLSIIAEVVDEGRRDGVFRDDLEPLFAAKMVFGVLDEMATDWVLSTKNSRLESRSEQVALFLVRGLAADGR